MVAGIQNKTRNNVRVSDMQPEEFLTKEGSRQGMLLFFFSIVIDDILN